MRQLALAFLLVALPLFAATPDNDASCDIAQLPAATLLLPYFEVDLDDPVGETTLFTVTNVTNVEQVAHVTLWTDYGVAVMDFDIFLTGYDVQSINFYDLLALGRIGPPLGTGFERPGSPEGDFSDDAANPLVDQETCRNIPRTFGFDVRERMRLAFTEGVIGTCQTAGGVHENAVGYATIDVARRCGAPAADEPGFIDGLLFENVLTGDYQQVNSRDDSAQGAPLVHIRAIPEGGGTVPFERTFYSVFQSGSNRTRDARQPLPTAFATHWIAGGAGSFKTKLKVWREPITNVRACDVLPLNARRELIDIVRFDENGNSETFDDNDMPELPVTSLVDINDTELVPPMNEVAGWMYLNFGAQAWVVGSMRAQHRFSVDVEATAFGNGCSPLVERGAPIGPAPNATASLQNDDSCDIAVLPAATLLLPYFEVDPADRFGETTLVTVTNTSAQPRFAHVTLWTDYAFPVLNFDILLDAYDTQSINMQDVIMFGRVPAFCGPTELPAATRRRVQQAFTTGRVDAAGSDPACNNIGSASHPNGHAVGYATIDVVEFCTTLDPDRPAYYDVIGHDNVLTGDYQQVNTNQEFAQGSPLVHIRAVPEGGAGSTFERTFYGRFSDRDTRQPLPSTIATRWIDGGTGSFQTSVKIWREGVTGANATCNQQVTNLTHAREFVTFDEEENAVSMQPFEHCPVLCPIPEVTLKSTGSYPFGDNEETFPMIEDALGGWLYLNLASASQAHAQQAWVTSSMRAEGRFSIDVDGTALGNGCSSLVDLSEVSSGTAVIGPAPNNNNP
jgi:hypothetical protein